MIRKENLPLVIGLALPVLLVIGLAVVIYVPRLYVQPAYDFVYATGDYPTYYDYEMGRRYDYRVIEGRLMKDETVYSGEASTRQIRVPTFYRHEVATDTSVMVSEEEAMGLVLDPARESPDGFVLSYDREADSVAEALFGGRQDRSQPVLEKGSVAVPLNLVVEGVRFNGYASDFVGWVK